MAQDRLIGSGPAQLAGARWDRTLLVVLLAFASLDRAEAASGIWTNLVGGNWSAGTNWKSGIIADGAGNTADLSTLTLNTAPTVMLDGPRTLGNLLFGDAGNQFGWTLNPGVGGLLTLAGATPTIIVNNQATVFNANLAGAASLTKGGAGTLVLGGVDTRTGGATIVNAGTLRFLNPVNTTASQSLVINTNAAVQTSATLNLDVIQNASVASVNVPGAGTLHLTATNSGPGNPDLYFGPDHNGAAYWGAQIAAKLDLGNAQRFIHARTGHNGVGRYGLTNADAQFAGSISGAGGLTLIAQMTWTATTPLMEVPFCLDASNSFAGPLEVQRGSVYLGNSNALTRANVLFLNAAAGNNARFFLYGNNVVVADLSSSATGNNAIANGNEKTGASLTLGAATLTVWQNNPGTFWGSIQDVLAEYDGSGSGTTGPLNLVKIGPATLTLAGTNSFTGTMAINAGELYVNGAATGGGTVTVGRGATLGGTGTINAPVLVVNSGVVEAGAGAAVGTLSVDRLALGTATGDATILNFDANPAGISSLRVPIGNGLTNNGKVTVNVNGVLPASAPVVYPLIEYSGALQGGGTFELGSLPDKAVAYLSNNVARSTLQLVVTAVTVPSVTWKGAPTNQWDLFGGQFWTQTGTSLPAAYQDGDWTVFDDGATNFLVNLATAVVPRGVVISNALQDFTFAGSGGITGYAGLLKEGTAALNLANSNSYSGPTTIASGTLILGEAGAIPGGTGAGNVTVNGTLNLAGFNTILNNLSGSGRIDNLNAGAAPILTITNSLATAFGGAVQNSSGMLGLTLIGTGSLTLSGTNGFTGPTLVRSGSLTVNGSLGAGGVTVSGGAALGGTGRIAGAVNLAAGATLNLTANAPLTVGALGINEFVSVNVAGAVSSTNPATYALLNHGPRTGVGSFLLAPITNLFNGPLTANLRDTNNQLLLVVGPTQVTGTIADVRHVVIFTQENRSFDHYFGSLHGVRGFSDRTMLAFPNGNSVLYQPNGGGYELPFHTSIPCLSDLGHDWSSTHQAWNSGNWNQWVPAKGVETMAYLTRGDLPYYYALADAFTVCDDYHCSTFSSTNPNRILLMTGMIDPDNTGGGPVIDNSEPAAGWRWTTYPERLQNAGIAWKIYQSADNFDDNALAWFTAYKQIGPGNPLYDRGMTFVPDVVSSFQADVSNNALPSVSWIVAPDYASEHPSWSPASGEALTKQLLDALAANPAVYNSTVFILNYDENDGFFDHTVPICPANGTAAEFVGGLPIGLGVRVPALIISPWSRGGYVCSQVFDHTSTIRFLEKWTGVLEPNISAWRRQVCGDLTSALDFAHPNTNYPSLLGVAPVNCGSGTTATPPVQQTLPTQEPGTLSARPLPYQPNASARTDCGAGTITICLTNSGQASVHFAIYPNAYRTDGPWPYEVNSGDAATTVFNVATNGGNYDFTGYGPNGFLRRFAGNLNADCGQIEAVLFLNPYTADVELLLANPGATPVVFSVTNGYAANGNNVTSYPVASRSTNVVTLSARTNDGWYDLTATANQDALFLRRFAGHVETNVPPVALASSALSSGYRDGVTFTALMAGYGVPSGTVQFKTNGVPLGVPILLTNGQAVTGTAGLPRGTNLVAAEYSGDLLNLPVTNYLSQIVTNHPPVAVPATFARLTGLPLRIGISNLVAQAADPDGDVLSLVGVDAVSALGTAIATTQHTITYNNTTNNAPDWFGYTLGDGFGGSVTGIVNVSVVPAANGEAVAIVVPVAGQALVSFAALPNYAYIVQRATSLAPPVVWVDLSTNTVASSGSFQVRDNFTDLPEPPAAAYYRLLIQ